MKKDKEPQKNPMPQIYSQEFIREVLKGFSMQRKKKFSNDTFEVSLGQFCKWLNNYFVFQLLEIGIEGTEGRLMAAKKEAEQKAYLDSIKLQRILNKLNNFYTSRDPHSLSTFHDAMYLARNDKEYENLPSDATFFALTKQVELVIAQSAESQKKFLKQKEGKPSIKNLKDVMFNLAYAFCELTGQSPTVDRKGSSVVDTPWLNSCQKIFDKIQPHLGRKIKKSEVITACEYGREELIKSGLYDSKKGVSRFILNPPAPLESQRPASQFGKLPSWLKIQKPWSI